MRAVTGAQLNLVRAHLADNRSRGWLLDTFLSGGIRLDASIVSGNQIDVNAAVPSQGTQLSRSMSTGKIRSNHSTVLFDTPLDRFFRIEDSGTAVVLASILGSTNTQAPTNFGGGAAAANFTRERCGYFRFTGDLAGTTVVPDPTLGTFNLTSGATPGVDPVTFAPTSAALVDACTASAFPNRDFYANPFGFAFFPTNLAHADIGAVERQPLTNELFRDGFE